MQLEDVNFIEKVTLNAEQVHTEEKMQQVNIGFILRPEPGETQSHWLRRLPQEIKEAWGNKRLKVFFRTHKI